MDVVNDAAVQAGHGAVNSTPAAFANGRVTAERPPEPEDIYWDSLEFSGGELARSQLAPSSIILLVALVGTAAIMFSQYGLGPVLQAAQTTGTLRMRILLQVGFTCGIIVGNIFIFILTPLLAERMEKHHTFGSKQFSCFLKMFLFQVFNTVVASTVFDFWATDDRHSWYAFGAPMIANVLIGDLGLILLVIDGLQIGLLVARYISAPRAKSQREMNDRFACKAEIYVAFRLQLVAKYITIVLIYGAALPIGYGLGALFLYLGQWVDRVNLLRRYLPPPRSPDGLISFMLRAILPIALVVHMLCAVLFYANEYWLVQSDPLCPEGVTITIAPVPTVEYGGAEPRCQTAATVREAQLSLYIVSAPPASGALPVRICRELCRSVERVHTLDGAEGGSARRLPRPRLPRGGRGRATSSTRRGVGRATTDAARASSAIAGSGSTCRRSRAPCCARCGGVQHYGRRRRWRRARSWRRAQREWWQCPPSRDAVMGRHFTRVWSGGRGTPDRMLASLALWVAFIGDMVAFEALIFIVVELGVRPPARGRVFVVWCCVAVVLAVFVLCVCAPLGHSLCCGRENRTSGEERKP